MTDYVHQIGDDESRRIQRFLYWAAAAGAAFVVCMLALFLTADAWLGWISPQAERRFIQPYIDLAEGRLLAPVDAELEHYVEGLGEALTRHVDVPAGMQLSFRVIDSETPNAYTTLGGYVFVNLGLLRKVDNENALAMVVAHEIAHAVMRDPLHSAGRGVILQLLLSAVSGGQVGGSGVGSAAAGDIGSQLMLTAYSREQEQQADLLALRVLQREYGHVGGATELFERLLQGPSEDEPAAVVQPQLEVLATHPELQHRIEYVRDTAQREGWVRQPVLPYPESVAAALKRP